MKPLLEPPGTEIPESRMPALPVVEPIDVLVGLVVFAGYMVFGVTGFGASPITIPVLVHLLPLTFVLALAAILDLSSALVLGFHTRRQADARELAALVPFTLVGLTLGVTLLVHLPSEHDAVGAGAVRVRLRALRDVPP